MYCSEDGKPKQQSGCAHITSTYLWPRMSSDDEHDMPVDAAANDDAEIEAALAAPEAVRRVDERASGRIAAHCGGTQVVGVDVERGEEVADAAAAAPSRAVPVRGAQCERGEADVCVKGGRGERKARGRE